jgi:superkiller protein 3
VAARLAGELPNEPAALDMRARVEVGFGNSAEAVKLWQNCLSLNRDFAPAYHGLGYVAKRKGDFDAAVTMFRKATAIDSQNRKFLTDLVEVLMEAGRMREAVEELKRLMESGPMTPAAALRLGQASLELDDFETARRAFEATLRAEPGERQAHFGLAKIHTRLGNPEKARFHTSEFQRLAARDRVRGGERNRDFAGMPVAREIAVRAHNETADFYEQHGRLVEAEDLWRRAAVLDPANVECRMRLLSLYEGAHRERKALRVCEQLRDLEPARADHWLNVGLLNARLDNVDAGLAAIQKAIDLDPDNPRYRQAYEAVKKAQ